MEERKEEQEFPFGQEIHIYIKHIESLRELIPLVMELVTGKLVKETRSVDSFINQNKIEEKEENGQKKIKIPSEKINEFLKLNDKVGAALIGQNYLPINFVVAFVSPI